MQLLRCPLAEIRRGSSFPVWMILLSARYVTTKLTLAVIVLPTIICIWLTTWGTLVNSLSEVTTTDWTRNLSRHFASRGGSSFIACRRTALASALIGQLIL
jgi:hypothetical protein